VTVLTDLEVEIQQCRLRHVMEAPTLGPLYAHCNRQKKQTPLYIFMFLQITKNKKKKQSREEFYLAFKTTLTHYVYARIFIDKAAAFVAWLAKIIEYLAVFAITRCNAVTERI